MTKEFFELSESAQAEMELAHKKALAEGKEVLVWPAEYQSAYSLHMTLEGGGDIFVRAGLEAAWKGPWKVYGAGVVHGAGGTCWDIVTASPREVMDWFSMYAPWEKEKARLLLESAVRGARVWLAQRGEWKGDLLAGFPCF